MNLSVTLETLDYQGIQIPNVPFNKLSILTANALHNTLARSSRLTSRDTRALTSYCIEQMRRFSLMPENSLEAILLFWDEASTTPTGPTGEFMVSFLMEFYSIWRSLTSQSSVDEMADLLVQLYPVMVKPTASNHDNDTLIDLKERYQISQSYCDLPPQSEMKTVFTQYPWILPWLVISHLPDVLVDRLLMLLGQIRATTPIEKQPGNPDTEVPGV